MEIKVTSIWNDQTQKISSNELDPKNTVLAHANLQNRSYPMPWHTLGLILNNKSTWSIIKKNS